MPIKTNNKDIQRVMCPAVNGVRPEAQAVRIHNGRAWIDVWTSLRLMTLLSNNITKGTLYVQTNGEMQYAKTMASGTGTMTGGGTMVFYLDGEWTNPTVTFDYEGAMLYEASSNVYATTSAGSISLYHRVKGGSTGTTTVLSNLGKEYQGDDFNFEMGSASKILSGTYDRLGISITIKSFSASYNYATMSVRVRNLKFGTQNIGFPMSAEFNY